MKFFIPILVIVFLSIPRVSENPFFQLTPIFLLCTAIFYLIHVINLRSIRFPKVLFLFIVITAIALIRNNNPDTPATASIYRVIELLLFVFFLALSYAWFKQKQIDALNILLFGIVVPFTIYCLINILFWLLQIKFDSQQELSIGKCVFLGQFGFNVDRVQFPFGSGINSFATVVGSVFTLVLALIYFYKKNRYLLFSCFIILGIVLVLTDSRSSLFFPVIAVILVNFIRQFRLKKWLIVIPFIPLLAPVILLFTIQLLQELDLVNAISRETEEVASANGRQVIWGISLIKLLHFELIHLFGYGQFGHYASGASLDWAPLFSRWKNGELAGTHNNVLMIIFDYGYFGLLIFILLIKDISKKIMNQWSAKETLANTTLAFIIYNILIGTTEAYLGTYIINALYVFLLIALILFQEKLDEVDFNVH